MNQQLKNKLSFLKEILKPLPPQQQEEILSNLSEESEESLFYGFADLFRRDSKYQLPFFYDPIERYQEVNRTHGITDVFEPNENLTFHEKIDAYVNWLDERGYTLINWFDEKYSFAYLLCKNSECSKLLEAAKRANQELVPLLPSRLMPAWFEKLDLPDENKEDIDFRAVVKEKLNLAKSMNRNLFLYCAMRECRPCSIFENNINHPLMKEACRDTFLLRVEVPDASSKLSSLYLWIRSAPIFVHITDNAMPSRHQLDGESWGEVDSVEIISQALLPFFKETNHPPLQATQDEIEESLHFLQSENEYRAMKMIIDEIDIKGWEGERRLLHTITKPWHDCQEKHLPIMRAIIEKLLDEGEDIDAQTEDGHTPLSFAVSHQHWRIAKLLLEYGANPLKCDREGSDSPLMQFLETWAKKVRQQAQ